MKTNDPNDTPPKHEAGDAATLDEGSTPGSGVPAEKPEEAAE